MNKEELVAAISEKTNLTKKDTKDFVEAFMEVVGETVEKGEDIKLVGFGSFLVKERKARVGRNPRNPEEEINIPASKTVTFKIGKKLKDIVNI